MTVGTNRHGRKYHLGRGREERLPQRHARWGAILLIAAIFAMGAGPAQAATGGAATLASTAARTGSGLAFSPMRWAGATWYGPGFYGSHTACGQVLRPGTIGVAHRKLPCNTPVRFAYHGHVLVARVIDRGPYSRGNAWDLTNGARRALRFNGSGKIGYAVARNFSRR
jgi:peptidoglycan lytic transglycosylase